MNDFVCQEKQQTANGSSRRFMGGAAFAQRKQKQTENMRIKPGNFENKSINYVRRTSTKALFPRAIFISAALSSDAKNRNAVRCCQSTCHRSSPTRAAQTRRCHSPGYPGVRDWQH